MLLLSDPWGRGWFDMDGFDTVMSGVCETLSWRQIHHIDMWWYPGKVSQHVSALLTLFFL
jgi:hypothetical protein